MRFSLVLGVVVIVVVGSHDQARACSCTPPSPPAEAAAVATAVFEGEVLTDRLGGGSGFWPRTLRFRVLRAWKGVGDNTVVEVHTGEGSSSCGYEMAIPTGTIMLVYAEAVEGLLTTGICDRTRNSADASDDIAALGPALPPAPEASGCAISGPFSADRQSPIRLAALLALVLVLAARRHRRPPSMAPPIAGE